MRTSRTTYYHLKKHCFASRNKLHTIFTFEFVYMTYKKSIKVNLIISFQPKFNLGLSLTLNLSKSVIHTLGTLNSEAPDNVEALELFFLGLRRFTCNVAIFIDGSLNTRLANQW